MTQTTPPFRADQVGSLLRPPEMIAARDAFDAGEISREALTEAENAAIAGVVAYQENLGLKAVTDGEYRRISYFVDFANGIEGVEATARGASGWDYQAADDSGSSVQATGVRVVDKAQWPDGGILLDDYAYLKTVAKVEPKMTMPAPNQIYWFGGRANIDADVYPDLDEFWADMIAVYRAEIAALAKAGCRYIQIDETCLPKISDPNMQAVLKARGDDVDHLIDVFTHVAASITADPPPGVTLALHHCRGNSRGHWQAEGSYEMVADRMFNEIPAAAHFLEYDSPRAGDFSPLRLVPDNKTIVLGLVTTKLRDLEDADALKRRIDEAAKYVPLERLCLSPQCGFSSSHSGHPLEIDDQTRKLELIVNVARDVWGDV